HNSIWFIGMIIIGGLGSILGAIIGTFFLKILQEFLTFLGPVMADLFPNLGGTEIWFGVTNVILGVIILLFLILEPRGFVHRWNVIKFGWRIWPFPY
ncbi:MAG: branched-chain amino acid ABC transporter permease, partial [Thermodesulfobacteriota bacterium]|nr:branched-chain amino acid ABC transporter permease [Thermodesulfobacteriota bacterium]